MARDRWHILRDGAGLTLARRLPVRLDLAVSTQMPAMGKLRLARQVRQDIWRALRGLRGFAPVVQVADAPGGALTLTAGGQVEGGLARAPFEARLRDVLENRANRARWTRHAAERRP